MGHTDKGNGVKNTRYTHLTQAPAGPGAPIKSLRSSWVRIASSVQSWVEDPMEVPERPRGGMRKIATNNYSTQARLLPARLIPINRSFPTTARWKRCVPGFISTAVVDGVHSLLIHSVA
jgi:hypothetical protein